MGWNKWSNFETEKKEMQNMNIVICEDQVEENGKWKKEEWLTGAVGLQSYSVEHRMANGDSALSYFLSRIEWKARQGEGVSGIGR